MPYDASGKNLMLDALRATAVRIHLHSGDPGAGANSNTSVLGGDGAGKTVTWAAASAGEVALAGAELFTGLGASQSVTHYSIWNTGGTTRYGRASISAGDTAANAAGEFSLTTATKLVITD
jgi:hypothetical protein